MQGLAIAMGGAFSPMPWHAPMMMLVGGTSALIGILRREQEARMASLAGI